MVDLKISFGCQSMEEAAVPFEKNINIHIVFVLPAEAFSLCVIMFTRAMIQLKNTNCWG